MIPTHEIYQKVQAETVRGEKILWAGQPAQGIIFRKSDAFIIPFSLFWAGFAFFWEASVLAKGITFFAIFGIPFVLIGIHMLIGRFFTDMWRRRKTFYGLTNERMIILSKSGVSSAPINKYTEIHFEPYANGKATIAIGSSAMVSGGSQKSMGGEPSVPTFEKIADGRRVYDMIKNIIRDDER